jgi:hypothetical protein
MKILSQVENTHDVAPVVGSVRRTAGILSEIQVEHGPAEILGPFFLLAEEAARQRGVHLSFAPLDALREANEQNRDSWRPLIPIFDTRHGGFTPDAGFCIVGRNGSGEIVATQAARRYDLCGSNFHDLIVTMRHLYIDPTDAHDGGERWYVEDEAIAATKSVVGTAIFSGASWYRPDYRGLFLSTILPRISRTLAYTRWRSTFTSSFMLEAVIKGGFAQKCGYTNVAQKICSENSSIGNLQMGFVWMNEDQLLSDLTAFSSGLAAKVDLSVERRTA